MADDSEPQSPGDGQEPDKGPVHGPDKESSTNNPQPPREEDKKQADSDDKNSSERSSGSARSDPPAPGSFAQTFENLYVGQANFGTYAAPAPEPRTTGRLEETEIAKIVRAYAEPACYDVAVAALAAESVIVLSGPAGSGRRTGAIAMLGRTRVPGRPLVGLSPAITVERLAARSFDEGVSYLINDMFDNELTLSVADFHWRNICRNIRKSKARLIVTVGVGSRIARLADDNHFPWSRPETAEVLRAHLGAAVIDNKIIDRVVDALGAGYPLSEIGAVAHKVSTAEDVEEMLAELQHANLLTVANWLDEKETEIPAVLEITALAFVVGVSERIFEAEVLDLKARMSEFVSETDTKGMGFREMRKQRTDHPLLTVRQVPLAGRSGSLTIRHVDFRMPMYRVHVITELWSRVSAEYWNVIRKWLRRIAADGDPDLINTTAMGLALLGLVAPDEVIDSYLDPWTDEDASWDEQTTAVYVVWRMSMIGQLAPLALQIAVHWAGQGTRTQRRAAAYAFSGELGARYPTEAVKRLTQLAEQGEVLAGQAHALLFATLAARDNDATIVLLEMRRRMRKEADRPSADRVSDAVIDLLSIRDSRSSRPSVAVFLLANPLRTSDIGPLWAHMLCLRPWRNRAITALLNVIGAIEHGHPDPEVLVRSLGSAIGKELPPGERESVRPALLAAAQGKGTKSSVSDDASRSQVSESLLDIFLATCASPFQKEVS